MGMRIGSDVHKELFCREFIETHLAYDVAATRWPVLDPGSLARLRALPFWTEAVSTERATAAKVQAQARLETDPLVREAVALQGYEEARHSALLEGLLAHYDIPVVPQSLQSLPADIEWDFYVPNTVSALIRFLLSGCLPSPKSRAFFPPS